MTRPTVLAIVFVLAAARAFAQTDGAPPDLTKVRVRIGPLWMNPSLALNNAGVDTNVFNDPAGAQPKRDSNVTITPLTDLWLRIGPTWVSGTIREEIVFYKKYSSERAANNSYRVGWRVPINRLTFSATLAYLTTRDRPGYEIDTRAQRSERGFGGSLEIRTLAKTYIGLRADQKTVNFHEGAQYLGINLHNEPNRQTTTGAINVRHELAPLTTVTIEAGRQ